jgi:lysophospholipase L1-like esterase
MKLLIFKIITMRKTILNYRLLPILFFLSTIVEAQDNPKWDDPLNNGWPPQFEIADIESTVDNKIQKAYYYFSKDNTPKPLIISLHTWSGGYTQQDPLVTQILEKDWNYIHPHFRGKNNTPEACGSLLVVPDIDDAISFAIKNANVDVNNIHIVGVSGGGYATMLAYMKSKHNIRSFSSWVGISDIHKWYYECLGRSGEERYAKHIAMATTGDTITIDVDEAISRSPIFMKTPVKERTNSKFFLYCGIHDGYNGSVPISQTVDFYNKLVSDTDYKNLESKVSPEIREVMIRQQNLNGVVTGKKIGGRDIIYQNSLQDKIYLTVFEGRHEMIEDVGLKHIPSESILLLGDSNGAFDHGWANQLKKLRPVDFIENTSISGNTIGFDNLKMESLNTLKNIDSYIDGCYQNYGSVDYVVILLGTNDCKTVFDGQLKEVSKNLEKLIAQIREKTKDESKIFVLTPPPCGPIHLLPERYEGSIDRVRFLKKEFEKVAKKTGIEFIDIHTPLEMIFENLTDDGIHLREEGQIIIAKMINESLN